MVEKATEPTEPTKPTEPEKTQYKEVIFSKQNNAGAEIAGAKIQIKQNGKVVSEWVSEKGQSHTIQLLPGAYTFHEELAPNGYLKVTDFEFTLSNSGQLILNGASKDVKLVDGKIVVVDREAPKDKFVKKGQKESERTLPKTGTQVLDSFVGVLLLGMVMLMMRVRYFRNLKK